MGAWPSQRGASSAPNVAEVQLFVGESFERFGLREASDRTLAPHALRIVFTRLGKLRVQVEGGVVCVPEGCALVVRADTPHRVMDATPRSSIYLDPERAGHVVQMWLARNGHTHRLLGVSRTDHLHAVVARPRGLDVRSLESVFWAALLGASEASAAPIDARIALAAGLVCTMDGPPCQRALAKRVGLSVGRLAHLFSEQIGIPVGHYSRWVRLRAAMTMVARGCSVTDAAMFTGFADLAHLCRTSARLMGQRMSLIMVNEGAPAWRVSE